MPSQYSTIEPNSWLFLRLPSKTLKCIELKPNTIIEVGKLGSFPSNLLLGRPYYFTYELLEKREDEAHSRLRIVTAQELNAEVVAEEATPSESRGEPDTPNGFTEELAEVYDVEAQDGTMKTNQLTIDDATRQALSQEEIEELKKSAGGKEIIEKILANHAGLDEKTVFSKAKYMLRKRSKYLKRFTVLPMDLGNVIEYVTDKEPGRILEMRDEALGLTTAWSNAHVTPVDRVDVGQDGRRIGGGRWLVIDEAGGLVVAALAERMNLLHRPQNDGLAVADDQQPNDADIHPVGTNVNGTIIATSDPALPNGDATHTKSLPEMTAASKHRDFPPPAATNTITILHPAVQPNISLLKYFGYDANIPDPNHPLHTHLKPLSWLQFLHPDEDPTYREPERVSETELANWKSGKRGTYWKKRRRWERCKSIVDEAREGGFDGLVIASNMDASTILPHVVPLVRGGGHVVIYSPTVEPLVQLMDIHSKERKAAYIQHLAKGETPALDDFPLDPRLLLAPTLQTSRVRDWQVLPGRTHPVMTGRGGAEGYVFTARKVVPLEGGVEARGNFVGKKRKAEGLGGGTGVDQKDAKK